MLNQSIVWLADLCYEESVALTELVGEAELEVEVGLCPLRFEFFFQGLWGEFRNVRSDHDQSHSSSTHLVVHIVLYPWFVPQGGPFLPTLHTLLSTVLEMLFAFVVYHGRPHRTAS